MSELPDINKLAALAAEELKKAADQQALDAFKSRWLGRKGELSQILRGVKDLAPELRREVGMLANQAREKLQTAFDSHKTELERNKVVPLDFDYTLPGRTIPRGAVHVLTQVTDEIVRIFYGMGFEVADGPEIETDYYNFTALNFPPDHPARDMQDTFFIDDAIKFIGDKTKTFELLYETGIHVINT